MVVQCVAWCKLIIENYLVFENMKFQFNFFPKNIYKYINRPSYMYAEFQNCSFQQWTAGKSENCLISQGNGSKSNLILTAYYAIFKFGLCH